ncbi:hypothetical protein [Rathayibacter sp. VKM Ac-2630]|uniref:hypothetical protein n=1 Tax=Rathayibacter sp. VKM Ac-2630 TaxID=1938617 RepID=UPI00098160BA|nr:hypothetical protein [Rathayibacter sp. VKM Ac-2630]OOB90314.1 hypothetical protein B0T42_12500 [Rathayibacter sp. VKM Ac-2630]
MHTGFTYALPDDQTVSLYLPPGIVPPSYIPVQRLGQVEQALRISDRDLTCENAAGDKHGARGCTDTDCHRRELGKCQCGRHPGELPFRRAAAPTTNRETTR